METLQVHQFCFDWRNSGGTLYLRENEPPFKVIARASSFYRVDLLDALVIAKEISGELFIKLRHEVMWVFVEKA